MCDSCLYCWEGESQDCEGKIILNSPHFALRGVGRHPTGLVRTHARKYTPDLSRQASVATWRVRIMTSIMSPYGEGEEERERESWR